MDLGLKGKLAVVTGSTQGIGQAIAKLLAREGARVIVNGRSDSSVQKALKTLDGEGDLHGIAADVSTAEGCQKLVTESQKLGDVAILINNAGIFEVKPFFEIPDADWTRFFETNVMSGLRLSRELAPAMTAAGWGRIIFISSESGISIPTEMIHYGVTKTAQLAVSRGLAKELKNTGVTVNSVLPGPTWSPGVEDFLKDFGGDLETAKANFFKDGRPASLIQRFADTDEVAALVAYLCGQQAAASTGAAFRCDGGLVDTCF